MSRTALDGARFCFQREERTPSLRKRYRLLPANAASYRVSGSTQLTSLERVLTSVSEDLLNEISEALFTRATDREASIREMVVGALCTLAGIAETEELTFEDQTALDIVLNAMSHDTSP
jgi:hypothetical protein